MTNRWPSRLVDFLFIKCLCLPLELTQESNSRTVRMLGIPAFALWCFPAMAVVGVPILVAIFLDIFVMAWHKEL